MDKKKLKTKQKPRPRDIWGKGNRTVYRKKWWQKEKSYSSPYEKDLEDGWKRVMEQE